jgi:hypothetical protein
MIAYDSSGFKPIFCGKYVTFRVVICKLRQITGVYALRTSSDL